MIATLKMIQEALKPHFPDAQFPPLRQPKPAMGFEQILRSGNREEVLATAESSLLPTYKRLKELLEALDNKIVDTVDKGQGAYAHLRSCRPQYCVYNDPYFASTAPLNEDYKKLVSNPKASRSAITIPMDEYLKIEKVLQGLQATQSFASWMLDALSTEIKRTEFEPVEPALFNGINKFLGSSMVESMHLSSSLFAFLRLRRREHFARDFPSSLSDDQRKALLSSSLANEKLFDNSLLLEFTDQHTTQASRSANIEVARSLPKLTSAVVASTSRKDQRSQYRQSSYRRDRRTPSSRRDRGYPSSSRDIRDRHPQSRSQDRGSSFHRGRSSSRGSRRPGRGYSRDKPIPPKSNFRK